MSAAPIAKAPRAIVLRGGRIVDGLGNAPFNGDVLILDGKVAYCGSITDHQVEGLEIKHVTGCTVLPGLIDTHVHVFDEGHTSPLDPTDAYQRGAGRIQAALQAGITTIRDVGSPFLTIFELRDAVRRGRLIGPRILSAGAAICAIKGHCHGTLAVETSGVAQTIRLVCEQIDNGADVIKVMATSGAGLSDEVEQPTQLNAQELEAAVKTAHAAGKKVLSHAHSSVGIHDSLAAGVDGIEHGIFLTDSLIETMLKSGATLAPTLSVYRRLADLDSQSSGPARARRIVAPHGDSVKRAIRAGVNVILGTDTGGDYHPLSDVVLELKMLVDAGMTPVDVIRAATSASAQACGIYDEVGALERGKRADVLIVEGDASLDIEAIAKVKMVLRDGVVVVQAGSVARDVEMVPNFGPPG